MPLEQANSGGPRQLARGISVFVFAALGVFAIAFGETWAPFVLGLTSGSTVGGWIELIVPFWPVAPLLVSAYIWSMRMR